MITAKDAKDLADNLQTQKAKECLKVIESRVRESAAQGNLCVDIGDLNPLNSILTHLVTLGYTVKRVKGNLHDTDLSITICW